MHARPTIEHSALADFIVRKTYGRHHTEADRFRGIDRASKR